MARIKNKTGTKEALSTQSVITLAQYVLAYFGYNPVEAKVFISEFRKIIPLPMMFSNDVTQVWIDKDYIAYSFLEEEAVEYVYITKKHIDEEERSYKAIHNKSLLPKSIRHGFFLAKEQMKKTNKSYAIFKEWRVKESKGEFSSQKFTLEI